MTFTNPSLVLTYTEDNSTSTITNQYIVRQSIKFNEKWINGLESSSNIVQLQLHQDCPDIISNSMSILKSNSDIKAVLKDGNTVVFTGYISESQQWSITSSGEKALNITLEDVGTRLLPKAYTRTGGKVVLEGAADSIARQICTACGITMDAGFPVISTQVLRVVEVGSSCKSLLNSLMMEVGYAYYFTNEGKLSARKIDCTSISGVPTLNKDDLYIYNNTGLALQKQIRQYKSSKVNYIAVGSRSDALIYKDISGQDDSHPDCNIELDANQTYPDPDGVASYVEATDLVNGNDLIYIDNVVPEVTIKQGTVQSAVSRFGADTLSVLLTCTSTGGFQKAIVSKLQAKADIKYVESENDVIAGVVSANDESNNMVEYKCEWIHTKTAAEALAKLFVNYYKYCSKQFQFYAMTDIECGAIVNILDDVFSGLSVNVMVVAKEYGDNSSAIKYTAVSVSEFDITIPTTTTKIYAAPSAVNVPVSQAVGTAAYFDVNLSSGVYKRNVRKTSNQELLVSISVSGYSETTASLTVDNGSFSSSSDVKTTTIAEGQSLTLYIPYNNDYDNITVRGILNANTEKRVVISAVNEVKSWLYLGALNALPVASNYGYDSFAPGDHFLCISDFGDYIAGNCYAWTGAEWWEASPEFVDNAGNRLGEDFYATAIMNCINDGVSTTFSTATQIGSWMNRLATNEVITNTLMAKELIMRSTGVLRSAQYTENENFPTAGYKLTSADGTLKAMNAYLTDVNIKCTDSQNAILLQTQRYQAGASGIVVRNSNLPARWSIDDLASTLTAENQKACTYNSESKFAYKPSTTVYTYGYRYLISTGSYQSGGWPSKSVGDSVYTFPLNGNYYLHIPYYDSGLAIWTESGTRITNYGGAIYYDIGYMNAGDQILIHACRNYRVYYYNEDYKIELSTRNTVSFNMTSTSWHGITGFKESTFSGYNYIPEIWVQPGSAMSLSMTCGNFSSSDNLNMYALSSGIAGWAQGSYNCSSGSSATVGSTTLTVSNIGVSSASVSFTDASYNTVQVSLPVSTETIATTGWAKNLNGSINLTAQTSAILTYNVIPSSNNACWLGDSNHAWYQVVSYGYNSLSSRDKKKDIEDYNGNATDIINGTKVVSFHYKDDEENRPKVGFIAEDTDPLMSTPEQNQFDLNNTVGLLLKAVQELSERIDRLEER